MRIILLIGLLIFSTNSLATVYRWVDESGKVHYSDKAKENAEAVDLKDNTLNEISINTPPKASITPKSDVQVVYTITIASPLEGATIRDNNGDFTVTVNVTPKLPRGILLTLLVDGVATAQPQTATVFQLNGVFRGEHNIVVNAVTQSGKVLASSSPRKIFLHQASLFGPARKSK